MPRDIVKVDVSKYVANKSQPSLRAYFGNVVKGQPEIYDTPFAKGESTENMINGWLKVVESLNTSWPTLVEYEKDQAKKVGPLSVMKPLKDRMADIGLYYEGIHLPSKPIERRAVSAVEAEWRPVNRLTVREMGRTVAEMKKSTNSGLPYFTKRRNVVDDTIPCAVIPFDRERYTVQNLQGKHYLTAAVLGWRGQEGGPENDDVKQRVIWMFPFAANIRELQVYQPLIEHIQQRKIVPAWVSMEQVDLEVTKLFDSKSDSDLCICTDFTKFDQHFNETLQDAARQVIARIFRANPSTLEWLRDVYPIKYQIPMMFNYGTLWVGKHGMASGSGGTNADETIAHRCLQYEAAILAGARLNPHSQCLGDDGIITYPGCTVEDVVQAYSSHGLEMNTTKQYAGTHDCIYLKRWHHKEYRIDGVCAGVYPTCRALGKLRYLERYMDPEIWGPEAVALRQLSIIENVKYHPLREKFVDYCMKRDKYRLGIDIPDFLDKIEEIAEKVIDYMPDFMGYVRSMQMGKSPAKGIANWWIVKYLKSKA